MPWVGNSSLNSDYFDADTEAKKIMASVKGAQAPAGIVPVAQSQRPVYSEPNQEAFDWTVPVSERPQGTEDWIWSRSRWAKENWDKEQDAKKDAAYKKYTIDLADWQAQQEAEQQKLTNYNNQLTAMGQTPMTSLTDLPAVQIRRLGQAWQGTTDPALRDQYHQQALQLAQSAGLIPQGYAGSVNGLPTLGLAGTPNWETQYKETAYKDALAQQALENQLAQNKASRSSGGSGTSGGSKPTKAETTKVNAIAWINANKGKFSGKYPAKNMYEQVKRNIAAGKMDPTLGAAILSQIKSLYME